MSACRQVDRNPDGGLMPDDADELGLSQRNLQIVDGAMLYAQQAASIAAGAFCERVRALSAIGEDRATAEQAVEALRQRLHNAVDEAYADAVKMVGDWWA